MAAAQQLNRAGHSVTLFEKNDRIGGLMRYGIPDFKMEKHHIDRRVEQMKAEGVEFVVNAHVGHNVSVEELRKNFDAVLLTGGSEAPRDIKAPGRELKGIYFAMEWLPNQNKRVAGDTVKGEFDVLATDRHVIIIGGGDTGADCLGTSHRHKCKSVTQFELMPMPPAQRSPNTPWPMWPLMLRTESAHEEGGRREWSILTTKFEGDEEGNVRKLHTVKVGPAPKFEPIPGSEQVWDADLVLLAMGFLGPVKGGMLEQLGVELDNRGNVKCDEGYMSSVPGVFAAGDMRRGQSLVVWAIAEGRKAARGVDAWLMGESKLPG
jgi:glutamate synthase (NADPH/NADH) small chain